VEFLHRQIEEQPTLAGRQTGLEQGEAIVGHGVGGGLLGSCSRVVFQYGVDFVRIGCSEILAYFAAEGVALAQILLHLARVLLRQRAELIEGRLTVPPLAVPTSAIMRPSKAARAASMRARIALLVLSGRGGRGKLAPIL
jgi:hypothetical protein